MLRRITTVAVMLVAALSPAAPAWADHTTAHTIEQMTAHYQDPALDPQNRPFALLYLRTTEGMRDANLAGEFSDPTFWDTEVIPTLANYYLDAYAAWRRGDYIGRGTPPGQTGGGRGLRAVGRALAPAAWDPSRHRPRHRPAAASSAR